MVVQFKVDQVHPPFQKWSFYRKLWLIVDMMGWIWVSMNHHLREVFLLKTHSWYPEEGEKKKKTKGKQPSVSSPVSALFNCRGRGNSKQSHVPKPWNWDTFGQVLFCSKRSSRWQGDNSLAIAADIRIRDRMNSNWINRTKTRVDSTMINSLTNKVTLHPPPDRPCSSEIPYLCLQSH